MKIPKVPVYLKKSGANFWKQVLSDYCLEDGHHLKLLESACQCLDRLDEARETIEKEGAFFVDRWNQPKSHPAVKMEQDNKILFSRLVRELCLDIETPKENRPPGLGR